MSARFFWSGAIISLFLLLGCETQSTVSQSPSAPEVKPLPSATQVIDLSEKIEINYSKSNSLSYAGYEVIKLNKRVRIEQTRGLTEVSYATLRRNGRTLATFDGLYSGFSNATDFGLISLLGGETKQLVISQTIPRNGRHWIIQLVPDFRVLFDSADYNVGREDLSIKDVDQNGIREILLELPAFYGFENLSSAATPLPEIIFRYDERKRKYIPANQDFQDYSLRGIEERITNLNRFTGEEYISTVLNIVLSYIYAGKEQEAWQFFDKEYKLQNGKVLKSRVQSVLRNELVYRFIYRRKVIS